MAKWSVKIVLSCLVACLLFSCSSTRLTYNYLDWIIDWYLDDYLSLNNLQEDFYRQRMAAFLRWHRTDELVRYSHFAAQLQQDMRGPLSASVLQERYGAINGFWRDSMERAAPECAELLLLLDQDQRRFLYAAAEKKQKQLEGKHVAEIAAERNRRQCELAQKAIERFTGGLTGPQKALLERWAEALSPVEPLWLENRRTWLRSFQSVLEGSEPEAEKQRQLRRLFVEPEYLWAPAYRECVRQNETAIFSMLADLHGTLTGKQLQHLNTELENLKKDFISLSQQ